MKSIGIDWFQMGFNSVTTGRKKTVFRVCHSARLFGCDFTDRRLLSTQQKAINDKNFGIDWFPVDLRTITCY